MVMRQKNWKWVIGYLIKCLKHMKTHISMKWVVKCMDKTQMVKK